jgi:hypothetical protein
MGRDSYQGKKGGDRSPFWRKGDVKNYFATEGTEIFGEFGEVLVSGKQFF